MRWVDRKNQADKDVPIPTVPQDRLGSENSRAEYAHWAWLLFNWESGERILDDKNNLLYSDLVF